jgi:hypothetical protein
MTSGRRPIKKNQQFNKKKRPTIQQKVVNLQKFSNEKKIKKVLTNTLLS